MDTKEQPLYAAADLPRTRRFHAPSLLLLIAGLAVGSAALVVYSLSGPGPAPAKKEPIGAAWSYEEVFSNPNWPKNRKPDFVVVITGQTDGYIQKCGCSDPQKGGLERRFNLIEGFKAHGIEAIPVDIGDVAPHQDHKLLHPQALLKYKTAMQAMKAMGYRVVGLGEAEFALGLHEALGAFSQQPGNEQPRVLAANLLGYKFNDKVTQKAQAFPNGVPNGSMIHDWDIISIPTKDKNKINVGVIGIVGDPIVQAVKKIDNKMVFAEPPGPKTDDIVRQSLKDMKKQQNQPNVNLMLYSGSGLLAEKAADMFAEFDLVIGPGGDASIVPTFSKTNPNTMVVLVGHKGQDIGVVGFFKNAKGGFDKFYQCVTLSPEFETPAGKEDKNAALKELEEYSKTVKNDNFLSKNRKVPYSLTSKATYVGSETCMKCHNAPANPNDNSWAVWSASKHAQAYNSLVNIAKKPSLRQFDGECIRCHTVGYDFNTGFVDAVKTPALKNVGCESCHGPASDHVANPMNQALALQLSPWKIEGAGNLPSAEKMKAYEEEKDQAKKQKILTEQETRIRDKVDRLVCITCHNQENDPHFRIETFWPKIVHSKMPAAKGAAPKPNANTKDDGPPIILPPAQPLPKPSVNPTDGGPPLGLPSGPAQQLPKP